MPPPVPFRPEDLALSELASIDRASPGRTCSRFLTREGTAHQGPLPTGPKYGPWLAKSPDVLQWCSFGDAALPSKNQLRLQVQDDPGRDSFPVWLYWQEGRLPSPWRPVTICGSTSPLHTHASTWVTSVEVQVQSLDTLLADLSSDAICLLWEGRLSADRVEACLVAGTRLKPRQGTQRLRESPHGDVFWFRMAVCLAWTARSRDNGALNLFYHQDYPPEHVVGVSMPPLAAILTTDELSPAGVSYLNDSRRDARVGVPQC